MGRLWGGRGAAPFNPRLPARSLSSPLSSPPTSTSTASGSGGSQPVRGWGPGSGGSVGHMGSQGGPWRGAEGIHGARGNLGICGWWAGGAYVGLGGVLGHVGSLGGSWRGGWGAHGSSAGGIPVGVRGAWGTWEEVWGCYWGAVDTWGSCGVHEGGCLGPLGVCCICRGGLHPGGSRWAVGQPWGAPRPSAPRAVRDPGAAPATHPGAGPG